MSGRDPCGSLRHLEGSCVRVTARRKAARHSLSRGLPLAGVRAPEPKVLERDGLNLISELEHGRISRQYATRITIGHRSRREARPLPARLF